MKVARRIPIGMALMLVLSLGIAGCAGEDGADGAAGAPGPAGENGENGQLGMDGEDGEDGEDGQNGMNGQNGVQGETGEQGPAGDPGDPGDPGPEGPSAAEVFNAQAEPSAVLTATIDSVVIDGGAPVISFTVRDEFGRGAVALRAGARGGNIRFTLAKLNAAEAGNSTAWQSYVNRLRDTAVQATYDRDGELVDHGNGSYTYTFVTDVTSVTEPVAVPYDAASTHRLVLQISGGSQPAVNLPYDFRPDGADIVTTRDIVTVASCNQCHNKLEIHGTRYETKYCVTCHNPGTIDSETGLTVDLGFMVHKIHQGANLPSVQAGGTYEAGGHDYSDVHFPQATSNCRKCHNAGIEETPDGNNWTLFPTRELCGSCHDGVNFDTGTGHLAGRQPTNANCAQCHTGDDIEAKHANENATPNNPLLPEGYADITYDVVGVTVNNQNQPVIQFNILRDGVALNLLSLPSDLTGPGRYPGFLLAYALPQGGVAEPDDYNNLGQDAGQPISVALNALIDGSAGTLVNSGDFFTATTNVAFPQGSRLRTVALQGYFNQVVGQANVARHASSDLAVVTGDTPRRQIIDTNGCAGCHEIFEGHGGNRVITAGSENVCVVCHNPNLSSSGTELDLDNPEATQNFRDLIHGIHAAGVRETPYTFVRNFRGGSLYDFSGVRYPGIISDCKTCHLEGTYGVPLGDDLLATTDITTDGINATVQDVAAARDSVPNDTDLVISPQTSSCRMCHDGAYAQAHMEQNGGVVHWTRAEYEALRPVEACATCHDSGSFAGVGAVHGQD